MPIIQNADHSIKHKWLRGGTLITFLTQFMETFPPIHMHYPMEQFKIVPSCS